LTLCKDGRPYARRQKVASSLLSFKNKNTINEGARIQKKKRAYAVI